MADNENQPTNDTNEVNHFDYLKNFNKIKLKFIF